MNSNRRQKISSAKTLLTQAVEIVSFVYDEEQDVLDNVPENLQSSERYEKIENACSALENAQENIEAAIEQLNDAIM